MPELSAQIARIIDDQIDAGAIGGAVALVQHDGETVDLQARGHADFDPSFALETDSVFGVMSMTKPIAAACAMMLVAEGRLVLEAPVARYIPAFAAPRLVRTLKPGEQYPAFPPARDVPLPPEPAYDVAAAEREITVRDILTFTSGLQTIGIPNGAPPVLSDHSLASYIPLLADVPLEFQPGGRWHYSNATGYDVLGRIIEIVTDQPFDSFAKERLFAPLGMAETRFGIDPAFAERVVPLGFLANAPVVRAAYPSGSAGVFSTARDYARFAQMLLQDGEIDGHRVLPAELAQAMHTPQIGDLPFGGIRSSQYARPVQAAPSAFSYGYGVGVLTRETLDERVPVGSYGWDGVGSRRFWVMPSLRTVLIMLMPGIGSGAEPAHRAIEAAVVDWADNRGRWTPLAALRRF